MTRELIWIFLSLAAAVSPPYAVRVEEKKAAPPQRIVVGSQVQAPYIGPEGRWVPLNKQLSEDEITAYEQTLFVHPDDICARAMLISFAYYPTPNYHTGNRIVHLLWMIQNHPEWEGFILGPKHGLANVRSEQERGDHNRLKEAWMEQIGPDQKRGIVLHNAAMFFAIREPAFAAKLLQRAIAAEPDVPLYVERLGTVFAYAFYRVSPPLDTTERQAFREEAQAALLSSNDSVLVAGAYGDIEALGNWLPPDLNRLLRQRMEAITGAGFDPWSSKLPSRSGRYRGSECDALFQH